MGEPHRADPPAGDLDFRDFDHRRAAAELCSFDHTPFGMCLAPSLEYGVADHAGRALRRRAVVQCGQRLGRQHGHRSGVEQQRQRLAVDAHVDARISEPGAAVLRTFEAQRHAAHGACGGPVRTLYPEFRGLEIPCPHPAGEPWRTQHAVDRAHAGQLPALRIRKDWNRAIGGDAERYRMAFLLRRQAREHRIRPQFPTQSFRSGQGRDALLGYYVAVDEIAAAGVGVEQQ